MAPTGIEVSVTKGCRTTPLGKIKIEPDNQTAVLETPVGRVFARTEHKRNFLWPIAASSVLIGPLVEFIPSFWETNLKIKFPDARDYVSYEIDESADTTRVDQDYLTNKGKVAIKVTTAKKFGDL